MSTLLAHSNTTPPREEDVVKIRLSSEIKIIEVWKNIDEFINME